MALAGASNGLATKAWSQAIRANNPAPAGQSYLTGDWGGLRSYLERNGVTKVVVPLYRDSQMGAMTLRSEADLTALKAQVSR